ncbi:MAG: transposase [Candidatus Helarchaeota archaeon]
MYLLIWKKKVIIQHQIDDYLGRAIVIFFDMTVPKHRYYCEKLLGGMGIKRRKPKQEPRQLSSMQTTLDQFSGNPPPMKPKPFKMPYRQKVILPPIPAWFHDSVESIAVQAYSTNRGYLKHLFQFNPLTFWEALPLTPKQRRLYRKLSMAEVFKLEIARYKRGITTYETWIDTLRYTPGLLHAVQIDPEVQECMTYRLIDGKILIWDGRFLESYCAKNKNKKLQAFSDQDAGKYKHIGKFRGVGYVDSTLICAKYNLPLYYHTFPGNRNDNISFRQTFSELATHNSCASKLLIADAGPYSNASLRLVKAAAIVPLIYARKNIKRHVIKIDTRKYINISHVPPEMIPVLKPLLALRTKIERAFSPARVVYHVERMNNRGMENAQMNVGKLKCTELLTALTAVKLHRLDLITRPTAFRKYSPEFAVDRIKIYSSEVPAAPFNALTSTLCSEN